MVGGEESLADTATHFEVPVTSLLKKVYQLCSAHVSFAATLDVRNKPTTLYASIHFYADFRSSLTSIQP